MADDPYAVLGVPRGATDEEIRRAFRRQAKECHPDLHPGDQAAAERFKRLSVANDVIGDPEVRSKYDRGEVDAAGEPRRTYQRTYSAGPRAGAGAGAGQRTRGGEDFGFGDIFSDLFTATRGRGPAARGSDARYSLEVDFLEAVTGARKRVTLPDGGTLDLSVPEGVTDGQVLRLKGKGTPSMRGGEPGDALVEIKVRPHAYFTRSGDDILIDLPLTLDEAVLGAKIEVPTLSGRVQLTIPKGTSSGQVFRLRGKGVRNLTTGVTGDLLAKAQIVLPESVDDQLAYFLSEWRQKNGYNPGRRW